MTIAALKCASFLSMSALPMGPAGTVPKVSAERDPSQPEPGSVPRSLLHPRQVSRLFCPPTLADQGTYEPGLVAHAHHPTYTEAEA